MLVRLRLSFLFVVGSALAASCGGRTAWTGDLDFDVGDEGVDAGRPLPPRDAGADRKGPIPTPSSKPRPPDPTPVPLPTPTGPCTNVSGHWTGTWRTGSGLSGTWDTYWTEGPNGDIDGKEAVGGANSCGSSAEVVGHRDGCRISFGVARLGGCSVDFVGTLGGDQMAGTFEVTAGVSDRGTWSGQRVN